MVDALSGLSQETLVTVAAVALGGIGLALVVSAVLANWRLRKLHARFARLKALHDAAEAKFTRLLDISGDGILIVPMDANGPILLANERAATLSGYSLSELARLRAVQLFPDHGDDHWLERAFVLGNGSVASVDMQRRSGELIEVSVDAAHVRHANHLALQIAFRPARAALATGTPRHSPHDAQAVMGLTAEQVTPALTRLLEGMVDRTRHGLSLEMAAVIMENPGSAQLALWVRRDIGPGLLRLTPLAPWLATLAKATDDQSGTVVWLAGASGWPSAMDALTTEGLRITAAVPLRVAGRRMGLMVLGSHTPRLLSPQEWDVLTQTGIEVERVAEVIWQYIRLSKATETLASMEQLYRQLLDVTPQALAAVDGAGRLTYYNRAARELLVLPAQSGIGQSLGDVADGQGALARLLRQATEGGMGPARHRIQVNPPTGEAIWIDAHIVPFSDSHGKITGAAVSLTPARRKFEEAAW